MPPTKITLTPEVTAEDKHIVCKNLYDYKVEKTERLLAALSRASSVLGRETEHPVVSGCNEYKACNQTSRRWPRAAHQGRPHLLDQILCHNCLFLPLG